MFWNTLDTADQVNAVRHCDAPQYKNNKEGGVDMTYKILLDNFTKIKKFVNITMNIEEPVTLHSGKYVVDGKSLLGIYSLDLTNPIEMVVGGNKDYSNVVYEFCV